MQAAKAGFPAAALLRNDNAGLLVHALAAIAVAVAIVTLLTPFGAAVSPDSILYLDIATHIHDGQGVTSTDYALARAGENLAVPNTIWPPLYPTLLAIGAAPPDVATAAIWSMALLAITLFFAQRIVAGFLPWSATLLAVLPLALAAPLLTIHTYIWSEQLFVAILVALLFAAQRYLRSDGQDVRVRQRWIALTGLLLVLAFYTRYIGLLFFPLLPLLYLSSNRPRALLATFVVACAACGLAAAALLTYNLHVSGNLTGAARVAAETTLLAQLRNLLSALVPLFLSRGSALVTAMFALSATAAVLFVVSARKGSSGAEPSRVAVRSVVAFDEIDVRLIGVVVPYLWIGCIALVAGFEWRLLRAAPALLATIVVATLAANGCFTLLEARANWHASGSPWFRINASGAYNNYNVPPNANQNRKFMAAHTNPDSVLVTDLPQVLRYTTGLTAYALPTDFSAVEMQKLAGFPPRSHIVLFSDQRRAFEEALQRHGARLPEATVAGDTVLLHLPLELSGDN
jgi:hypothetical protein